jgi:catechol 2,3-dioxygenase-like lactoylglutathione lyase family enzyme
MIKVKQTHHVNITVRDLDRALDFYGRIMGLPTIPRPGSGMLAPGEWYQLGDKQLHVSAYPDEPPPSSRRHVAIEVEDFDETVRVLAEHNIATLDNTPATRANGSRFLFCEDPDGNRIEIMGDVRS